jgi:hypothetical protein
MPRRVQASEPEDAYPVVARIVSEEKANRPLRAERPAPGVSGRPSMAARMETTAFGAISGLVIGPVALGLAAFVLGGLGRAAPCHRAADFLSGAIFACGAVIAILGLPAIGGGCVVGAILGAVLSGRQPSFPKVFAILAIAAIPILACLWYLAARLSGG